MKFTFTPSFQSLSASPIRALLKDSQAPGMISFAGGLPAREVIDVAGLRAAMTQMPQAVFEDAMQYGDTQGAPALHQALLRVSHNRGLNVQAEELLVSSGSQQALDLLLRATISAGDVVLVERASYPGALQAFRLAGAALVAVATDDEGMVPDALEAALKASRGKAKIVYTVATFGNPTGTTWSRQRRIRIAQLAAQYGVLLVEDDAYSLLRFRGAMIEPIRALAGSAQDHVVYISTLSKVVAPGLRVGWLVADAAIVQRCIMAKQVSDMCTSVLSQALAVSYLDGQGLARHVPDIVHHYQSRAALMAASLREHFGDALVFHEPEGGMFIWACLPQGMDASQAFKVAAREGVMFVPGEAFGGSELRRYLRLSFSCTTAQDIALGVARLKQAVYA